MVDLVGGPDDGRKLDIREGTPWIRIRYHNPKHRLYRPDPAEPSGRTARYERDQGDSSRYLFLRNEP